MKLIAAPSINIVHNRVLIIVESLILVVVPRNLPLLPLQGAIEAGVGLSRHSVLTGNLHNIGRINLNKDRNCTTSYQATGYTILARCDSLECWVVLCLKSMGPTTVGNQEMKCDRQPNFKQYSKLSHRAEIPSIRRAVVSFSLSKVNSVTGN